MKVKFFYTNGYCGCDETEVVDFPNINNIDNSEIDCYGNEAFDIYMESWADGRFVNYPDEDDFESYEAYENAYNEAYEEYFENGSWWCEEYTEEDEDE